MKKIGLVGGISWTSTMDYYRFLNQEINERLGGLNFAECIIYSVNYNDFRACTKVHNWEGGAALLTNAATQLEKAGADMILLCANTAHIVAEKVSEAIQIP